VKLLKIDGNDDILSLSIVLRNLNGFKMMPNHSWHYGSIYSLSCGCTLHIKLGKVSHSYECSSLQTSVKLSDSATNVQVGEEDLS
jgi:hypothetical protein